MKKISIIFMVVLITIALNNCRTRVNNNNSIVYNDSTQLNTEGHIVINLTNGTSFNHPTYVIWEEDMSGKYQKTTFITKSYASGIFGHEMVGDTMWLKKEGSSYQPAALPYWTHKKGLINDKQLIPTPDQPFIDAYTGATPKQNFQFKSNVNQKTAQFRLLLEVNQTWDWNKYWTNNKYPNSDAYKNSAQPSIVYAVTINDQDSVFYMNPIGHGDPKGESGKLFSDLSSLSTAKNIFESIKIEIKK